MNPMFGSSSTKDFLYSELRSAFDPEVVFKLQQVYQLMLNDVETDMYDDLEEPEATIRRDLQELRDDNLLTFVDYNGSYYLNSVPNVNFKENIFSLEQLEKHGRIIMWNDKLKQTTAPGIKFIKWMIADKNVVMSHEIARKLNIPCQTRAGKALFQQTIDKIRDDIIDNGYDYHCFQPAIEKLPEPVEFEEKVYEYIVRDGINRFEIPWAHFPCALIKGESEYDSLQYGCMANNPNTEKKNDNTPEDVKRMIRLGFECGRIAKTQDAVYNVLVERYKETRKKDRRNFVSEILLEEGIRVSVEPYDITKAIKHLKDNYKVEVDETCFVNGYGREADHYRKQYVKYETMIQNPDVQYTEYAFLEIGSGVSVQPNEENADELRLKLEGLDRMYEKHCCSVADAVRKGKLKRPQKLWLAQINENEQYNEFQ